MVQSEGLQNFFHFMFNSEKVEKQQRIANDYLQQFYENYKADDEKKEKMDGWRDRYNAFLKKVSDLLGENESRDEIFSFDLAIPLSLSVRHCIEGALGNSNKNTNKLWIFSGGLLKKFYDPLYELYKDRFAEQNFDLRIICGENCDNDSLFHQNCEEKITKRKTENISDFNNDFHFICTDKVFMTHLLHRESDYLRYASYIWIDGLKNKQEDFHKIVESVMKET